MAIAQHIKPKNVKAHCNIFSSLSFAFSCLIFSINDVEPLVSQKAVTYIETLSDQAIRSIVTCFEFQFDCVIIDRPIIMRVISKFYTCMLSASSRPQTAVLTWEFFMQRFNTLSIENQLANNVLAPVDISGVSASNNNFQRKINIAKFALKRSEHVRTISDELCEFCAKFSRVNVFVSPITKFFKRSTNKQKQSSPSQQVKCTKNKIVNGIY